MNRRQTIYSICSLRSLWLMLVVLCLVAVARLEAQTAEDKELAPSERFYNIRSKTSSLGVGGLVLKDEYLSPLNYGGISILYSQETSQLRYKYPSQGFSLLKPLIGNGERSTSRSWLGQRHFVFALGHTSNPAQNANISRLELRLSGSRQYRLSEGRWGSVSLGPGYTLGGGGLYSSRNGNNPATLKLDGGLTLALSYAYRLPWRSFPALIRLSSRTDLVGLRWEQQYGESYYELYYLSEALGKRLALTHLGNSLGQELRINIDIPLFDRYVYSVLYRYQHKSWDINQLYNKLNEHSISLGITRYFRPLGGRRWLQHNIEALPF